MLLERKQLTSGTTWHAAGLIGQLRASSDMTRLAKYTADLYVRLEEETGVATGMRQCGSVSVALTNERRKNSCARPRWAALAVWTSRRSRRPGQGQISASRNLRRGRRRLHPEGRPGRPRQHHPGAGQGRAHERRTSSNRPRCSKYARKRPRHRRHRRARRRGHADRLRSHRQLRRMWAHGVGRMAGVTVPLHACEHFYIITSDPRSRPPAGAARAGRVCLLQGGREKSCSAPSNPWPSPGA